LPSSSMASRISSAAASIGRRSYRNEDFVDNTYIHNSKGIPYINAYVPLKTYRDVSDTVGDVCGVVHE
jgi:hypothetical protein